MSPPPPSYFGLEKKELQKEEKPVGQAIKNQVALSAQGVEHPNS